jgi:hypothetical protein
MRTLWMALRLCVRKLSVVVHIQPLESLKFDPLESLTFVHILHMKGSIISSYRYERSQKAVLANEEDSLWVGGWVSLFFAPLLAQSDVRGGFHVPIPHTHMGLG